MTKPNLQVALDNNTLESALADVKAVGDIVDIVEAGTILILQEGTKAVSSLRALYPKKRLLRIRNVPMLVAPSPKIWPMPALIG